MYLDKRHYACRNCDYTEGDVIDGNTSGVLIYRKKRDYSSLKREWYASNPHLHKDLTYKRVPRACSSRECDSNTSLVVCYDRENLRYMYVCTDCGKKDTPGEEIKK